MSGGWQGSTRRYELPDDWPDRRRAVLERDNYRCQWRERGGYCNAPATDVDHIAPGNDDRHTNLQALCRHHHAIKSSAEGNTARWQHRRARPPEQHPGLIKPGDQSQPGF